MNDLKCNNILIYSVFYIKKKISLHYQLTPFKCYVESQIFVSSFVHKWIEVQKEYMALDNPTNTIVKEEFECGFLCNYVFSQMSHFWK